VSSYDDDEMRFLMNENIKLNNELQELHNRVQEVEDDRRYDMEVCYFNFIGKIIQFLHDSGSKREIS